MSPEEERAIRINSGYKSGLSQLLQTGTMQDAAHRQQVIGELERAIRRIENPLNAIDDIGALMALCEVLERIKAGEQV